MDNNRSGPPEKRKRWDYADNILPNFGPISPLNVNAFNSSWRSSYNGRTQAEEDLKMKYSELEKKYHVLESVNAQLVKTHHDLFILYESQRVHITQLPTQTEVTRLNQRIIGMEAEKQLYLKNIADLEQGRVADKERIAQFVKKEVATKHALESEKEKSAGLRQIIDEMKASNKDRDQLLEQMKKQLEVVQAITTDSQGKRKAEHSAPVKEKVALKASTIEPNNKQKARVSKSKATKNVKMASEAKSVETQRKQIRARDDSKSETSEIENGPTVLTIVEYEMRKKVAAQNALKSKASEKEKVAARKVCKEESITELSLQDQNLTWKEYVKHVSPGTIKSVHLVRVRVEKSNGDVASLEEIMEKVSNVQMFECVFSVIGTTESIALTQQTFPNLLKLAPFKNLQKFNLYGITLQKFDVDCFLDFMKVHPNCLFMLSFHFTGKNKFKDIAKKLREAYPSKTKLVIDLLRSDLTVLHR